MNKRTDCRHAYLKRLTTICAGLVLASILSAPAHARSVNYQSLAANVNGVRVHYLKAGTGKRPLVLIHGFGDTSHMWVPLFDEFGKDFTVIAPDMRGLGDSSKPATGYDKKTMAVDIHELVKSLGYQKINLVGHDIGLMVAYAYAAQYPDEVERLALLDAPIPGVGDVWEKIYTTPALWHFHFVNSPVALELVKGRERLFLEHFWQTLSPHPETFPESDRRLYAKSYAQEGAMRAAFEMFKLFNTQDAADNRRFAAVKLPMPVLTIEGDKAMGGALEIQAKLVADNVTSIKLADTGHWLMEQRPEETKAALKRFFGLTAQANQWQFWKSRLLATGRVVKQGRTVGLVECDITDEKGRLLARATSTCMSLRDEQAQGR